MLRTLFWQTRQTQFGKSFRTQSIGTPKKNWCRTRMTRILTWGQGVCCKFSLGLLAKFVLSDGTLHRRRNRQKRRQRSSLMFQFHAALMIWNKGLIEERTLGSMDASEKWMFFPKTFLPIIFAAKWLVRHSSSPQTAATTYAFSSVCFLSYCMILGHCQAPHP